MNCVLGEKGSPSWGRIVLTGLVPAHWAAADIPERPLEAEDMSTPSSVPPVRVWVQVQQHSPASDYFDVDSVKTDVCNIPRERHPPIGNGIHFAHPSKTF